MSRLLVVGSGIAGLSAAISAARAGAEVLLTDSGPFLGGRRAAMLLEDSDQGTTAADLPVVSGLSDLPGLEARTLTRVHEISQEADGFRVVMETQGRFVTADCTRCGHCLPVCPELTFNELDAGLTSRKAIHGFYQGAQPHAFVIDLATCLNDPPNYLPCQRCTDVCDDKAVDFSMAVSHREVVMVSAVILATGADEGVAIESLKEFGYEAHADVMTTVELQRLLESPGPSGGFAIRLSNEEYVDSAVLVLPEVTPETARVVSEQAAVLMAQDVDAVRILVLDPPDKIDKSLLALPAEVDISYGAWLGVAETETGQLEIRYVDLNDNTSRQVNTDILVLATGATPRAQEIAPGLALDDAGYIQVDEHGQTSIADLYAAGAVTGCFSIPAAIDQARTAAAGAIRNMEIDELPATPAAVEGWDSLSPSDRKTVLEKLLFRLLETRQP